MLDREGHPINGVSIDLFVMAVFIAYVIAMETRTGATLGGRATRIRVLNAAATDASGVPLRKSMVRYLVLCIGTRHRPVLLRLLRRYGCGCVRCQRLLHMVYTRRDPGVRLGLG
jgi:uncharacterized RDD family membrane protein YckC